MIYIYITIFIYEIKNWIFFPECFLLRQILFFFGFLVLCFPASDFLLLWFSAFLLFLLLCFSAFLLSCFSASLPLWFLLFLLLCFLLLCFHCFFAFRASLLFCFSSLLFCFSVFPASLLACFCAFLLLLFYFSFLQSCVFAALLPAPLLLCFLSLLSLCFSFCFILSCLYPKWNPRETLGETQRNPKEILIRKARGSHLPLPHVGSHLPRLKVEVGANVTLG